MTLHPIILLSTMLCVVTSQAFAQTTARGRVDLSVGARWTGETSVGAADATETAAAGNRYRLFTTDSALVSMVGVETRVDVRLTRAVEAEVAASYGARDLRTRIRSDVEGVPDTEAVEKVGQVSLEASLVVHLTRWPIARRATPFVTAGGGYLRELHEGRTLAETGAMYHAGGGLTMMLRSGGRGLLKAAGWRADARAVVRTGGIVFSDELRVAPAVGLSLFARF